MKRHSQEAAAVLFIDIDDFKVVNDCYGHATGDLLIKEVSNRLRASMRSDGTIARMGGDEFTMLVEDVTDPSDAIRVAERIQSSFTRPFLLGGLEIFKSASIGIALTSPNTSASRNTSRCPLQDSRSGWIRYFLSCRALASPTTCRFSPAHSGLPVNKLCEWLPGTRHNDSADIEFKGGGDV